MNHKFDQCGSQKDEYYRAMLMMHQLVYLSTLRCILPDHAHDASANLLLNTQQMNTTGPRS